MRRLAGLTGLVGLLRAVVPAQAHLVVDGAGEGGGRLAAATAKLAGAHRADGEAKVNEDHDAEELPR